MTRIYIWKASGLPQLGELSRFRRAKQHGRKAIRVLFALGIMLGALLSPAAYTQKVHFVNDTSKPYAYLRFDHVGKRKPIRSEESAEGLWLRFVNNSNVPVEVGSFDPGTDAGTGLLDEVLPYSNPGVRPQSVNPPEGYSGEVHSSLIVQPGDAVLFSAPREHVSKQWYLRVRFTLVVGNESVQQPFSYVEFTEGMLR